LATSAFSCLGRGLILGGHGLADVLGSRIAPFLQRLQRYRHDCGALRQSQQAVADCGSAPRFFKCCIESCRVFSYPFDVKHVRFRYSEWQRQTPNGAVRGTEDTDPYAERQASPSGSEAAAEAMSSASAKPWRSALALHESGAIDGNLVKNDGGQRKPDLGHRIRRRQWQPR
jgi:hypothetical protein